MIAFIFVSALMNLALGVAIAVLTSRDLAELHLLLPQWPSRFLRRKTADADSHSTPMEHHDSHANEPQLPERDTFPAEWQDVIDAEHLQAQSFVEAALLFLRHVLERYRAQLFEQETSVRSLDESSDPAGLKVCSTALQASLQTWQTDVDGVIDHLTARRGVEDRHEANRNALEETLLDQVGRLTTIRERAAANSAHDLPLELRRRILAEIVQAIELVDDMRDGVLEILAVLLTDDRRLASLPAAFTIDAESGLLNRLGIEQRYLEWRMKDPNFRRTLSGSLIEIDRFEKLHEQRGGRVAYGTTVAFARMAETVTRRERGDFVARASSRAIFLFLSDAVTRDGKNAAERVRQVLEAATFETDDGAFTPAANAAVSEFFSDDTPTTLLARLRSGILEVRKGGGNRTAVDEGQGAVLVEPVTAQVKSRTVNLD